EAIRLFHEARELILDKVRADIKEDQEKTENRKREEQEYRHSADEDVGEDQLAAHPPENRAANAEGPLMNGEKRKDDERKIDDAIGVVEGLCSTRRPNSRHDRPFQDDGCEKHPAGP